MTAHLKDIGKNIGQPASTTGWVDVPHRPGLYRNLFKRIFDLTAVITSSVIVVPVVAVLALIVARDGSSPFYWNDRVGRNGRTFRMLKLRTMVPDAERQLQRHLSENAERPAHNDDRVVPQEDVARRASAALECADGRHVPCRAASDDAQPAAALYRACLLRVAAWHHGALAGIGPERERIRQASGIRHGL
jgi:hypothetical protein